MRIEKPKTLTFRDAYKAERKSFGNVRPGTITFKDRKAYDRRAEKARDRRRFLEGE